MGKEKRERGGLWAPGGEIAVGVRDGGATPGDGHSTTSCDQRNQSRWGWAWLACCALVATESIWIVKLVQTDEKQIAR